MSFFYHLYDKFYSEFYFDKNSIVMFDAIVATFYAKYYYNLLSPVTYINNEMGYNQWKSVYPTPQHPSYPAVAPSTISAAIMVLEQSFGQDYNFIDDTQEDLYGSKSYNTFNALLDDVGRSRTYSGLNFIPSVETGILQGRTIGELVNKLPFKKL